MEQRAAQIISYIFHPLLMPSYGLLLLFANRNVFTFMLPFQAKAAVLFIVFLNTSLLPAFIFYLMKRRGMLSSLRMENRTERVFPFIIAALFYFTTYFMLRKFQLPSLLYFMLFGSACLIVIALIVNFWWKISIHMLAIGGLTGAFFSMAVFVPLNFFVTVSIAILASGLTGFSRLKLNAHTPAQVYGGFVTGSFFMIFLFIILY